MLQPLFGQLVGQIVIHISGMPFHFYKSYRQAFTCFPAESRVGLRSRFIGLPDPLRPFSHPFIVMVDFQCRDFVLQTVSDHLFCSFDFPGHIMHFRKLGVIIFL